MTQHAPARRASERRLDVQYELSRQLAAADDLAEVAPVVLRTLCMRLRWRTASLWVPAGTELRCLAISADRPELAEWEAVTLRSAFKSGEGLPGRVWQSGRPFWLADLAIASNFPRRAAARRGRLRHGVALPVLVDGTVRAVLECYGSRIRQDNAALLRFLEAVGHQLAAFLRRTEARHALRVSEARKTAILAAAVDAIVSSDQTGRIVEFNSAAERLFGRTASEVAGRSIAEVLVPPQLRETHTEGMRRYLDTGASRIIGERVRTTALHVDGSQIPVELTVTEARLEEERLFTAFIRDVTAVREGEVARDRFLEILSHELRTPITAIYGGATMLNRSTLPEASRATLVADVGAEADRLYRLVENLVVLARAERGARDVALEPVHLAAVVRRVVNGEQLRWSELDVRLDIAGGGPVLGEETWIEQVLRNLLSNAAKYAADGEVVNVVVTYTDDEATVRVLDAGPGIQADEAVRLFEIDFRSSSTARVASGSGIGLFVARWLIEGMGGRIWACRRPEGGSEFGFAIPRLGEDVDIPTAGPITIPATV